MERLAHKIAEKITLQLNFDQDRNDIIAYGLIGMLQVITIFLIITTVGIIFNFWYESVIIFFGVGYIRKSTGGAHASTMNSCNTLSVLSILLLSALSRYVLGYPFNMHINLGCSILVFIICFIIFYLRVPVDNPKKPIINPDKIRRLRKQSFLKLTLLFIISILFIKLAAYYDRFYSIAVSIRLAMLWQMLTLTKIGALIVEKIDSKVNSVMEKYL